MTYEKICDSNNVAVLRHFIRVKATTCRYAERGEELMSWIHLSDADFILRNPHSKLENLNNA